MMVHKAYKYRIYPNPEQRQLIHQMFGCCRFVFNHFLTKWNETYAARFYAFMEDGAERKPGLILLSIMGSNTELSHRIKGDTD